MNTQAASPLSQNALQRLYESRTFDIVFGIVPAVLMSLFCLFVILVTSTHLTWIAAGWIPVKYLFILSITGLASCVSLICCISDEGSRPDFGGRLYLSSLYLGILNAATVFLLVCQTAALGRTNALTLAWPLIIVTPLVVAAIKQINLLNSPEPGRRS